MEPFSVAHQHIKHGKQLEDFLDDNPTVHREPVEAFLEMRTYVLGTLSYVKGTCLTFSPPTACWIRFAGPEPHWWSAKK